MVPVKRKMMVVSGAIAAALALPGCAPAGYNANDYAAGAAPEQEPAANEQEAEAGAEAEEQAAEDERAPELSDEELTNELVGASVPRMGKVVQDEDGWILYRFDDDTIDPSVSNCEGECAEVWPPALTDGEPELDSVKAGDIGTVEREDGTKQLTLDGWPLYRYIGDKKPGQWKGQGVGGKWFVVQPNGKKNLTCLPKGTPKAVSPPDGDEKSGSDESGGGGSGSDYSY